MKILLVHNEYQQRGGEEAVVKTIRGLLERHGHEALSFIRNSAEIGKMRLGKAHAFVSGIYSRSARREFRSLLAENRPDVVHVHNLFPLISPSILPECRLAGIPVVMTVHNHRLVCPNGLLMIGGQPCEKCMGGHEYWCVIRNCEENPFKSLGYALRSFVARKFRLFSDNVTLFVTPSNSQREVLIHGGFASDRIVVFPHMVNADGTHGKSRLGHYVGFIGRIAPEKGLDTFLRAGKLCENIPFKAAGDYRRMPHLPAVSPPNLEFLGGLAGAQVDEFYRSARMIVIPSIWSETFGLCAIEAMLRGKPVICSRLGGLAEIVEEGKDGFLFEAGNAEELADRIQYLWAKPELCEEMGRNGFEKARSKYCGERYYQGLMEIYAEAIARAKPARLRK